MDPDTDVCQTEQPQISYSFDFTAEQSSAMGSPILLDREGICILYTDQKSERAGTGTLFCVLPKTRVTIMHHNSCLGTSLDTESAGKQMSTSTTKKCEYSAQ